MFNFIKNILKKENKKENKKEIYTISKFESDINNIKNKSKSNGLLSSYFIYEILMLILSLTSFVFVFYSFFKLSDLYNVENVFINFSLFCLIFISTLYTFLKLNNIFENYFMKKIYGKIYNENFLKKLKEYNSAMFNFDISEELYILNNNENFNFIINFNEEDKILFLYKLSELNYDFNRNIRILDYFESKILLAFKNKDFMKLLKSIKQDKLYKKMKPEIIDCFKSNEKIYFQLLDNLFENLEEYEKDKLYYTSLNLDIKINNIDLNLYNF